MFYQTKLGLRNLTKSHLPDGLGGLDGDGDLVHAVDLDLGLKRSSEVDGGIDTSSDLELA